MADLQVLYDRLSTMYDKLGQSFDELSCDLLTAEHLADAKGEEINSLQNKLAQLNTLCRLSEVNQDHLDSMAVSKSKTEQQLKEARAEIATLKQGAQKDAKQTKRDKRSAKRKADKAPVVNLAQMQKLKQSLEEHQHALNFAAVRVGGFINTKGVTYDVYDNKVRTVTTPKGDMRAHQLFLINQYGAGRMIYQNVDDGKLHVCAIPPQARWHLCKDLEKYCENYFKQYANNSKGSKNGR